MAAAGDLHPFGQQRLTLPLQIGAGEGDIAMAIDYPMPGQSGPFRQTLQHTAHLARRARRTSQPGDIAIGRDIPFRYRRHNVPDTLGKFIVRIHIQSCYPKNASISADLQAVQPARSGGLFDGERQSEAEDLHAMDIVGR